MLRDEVMVSQLFSAYREHVERGGEDTPATHMERFRAYADTYKSFDEFGETTREGLFFYRLGQLDTTTVFPLLLEAIRRFDNSDGRAELQQILGDLESFFVRRTVCELTGKNYNKVIVELLKEVQRSGALSAATIRGFLLRQESEVSRWPSDEEFRKAWMTIEFYRRLKKSRGRMILEALEAALHTGKTEKVQIERKLTIEHLMPREWEAHWPLSERGSSSEGEAAAEVRKRSLHRIGNLTLLTKQLNPAISNGPWARKRADILRHSALNLNRELPEVWSEQAIEARSGELFGVAVKVWPHPGTGAVGG
jgi:hypothetical protein